MIFLSVHPISPRGTSEPNVMKFPSGIPEILQWPECNTQIYSDHDLWPSKSNLLIFESWMLAPNLKNSPQGGLDIQRSQEWDGYEVTVTLTTKIWVHLSIKMHICEEIPSRHSWDIAFTRMRRTTLKPNAFGHGCRWCGGITMVVYMHIYWFCTDKNVYHTDQKLQVGNE